MPHYEGTLHISTRTIIIFHYQLPKLYQAQDFFWIHQTIMPRRTTLRTLLNPSIMLEDHRNTAQLLFQPSLYTFKLDFIHPSLFRNSSLQYDTDATIN